MFRLVIQVILFYIFFLPKTGGRVQLLTKSVQVVGLQISTNVVRDK